MNFLEQLVAEWYEYNAYWVRRNTRARKLPRGGWQLELDVLAYKAATKELVHVEASGDASTWDQRRERMINKKFVLTKAEYESLLQCEVSTLHRVALVGWSKKARQPKTWGDSIELVTIPAFLQSVASRLRNQEFGKGAVPENYPILRCIQLVMGLPTDGS